MNDRQTSPTTHRHVFLAPGHELAERKTWTVIWLCTAMMILEIIGGLLFGSIALVADGLHMSTHAGALLLAALAYTYARKQADNPAFTFGTGKLGDLAGYTSALILAMIALLIGYESIQRLFNPVPIRFEEAIPIACLGLAVNIVSAWLLGGGHHHHGGHHDHGSHHDHHAHSHHAHSHDSSHDHSHDHDATPAHRHEEAKIIATAAGPLVLQIFESGVPPRFRLARQTSVHGGGQILAAIAEIETLRPDGARQIFTLRPNGDFLESTEIIPEPHEFSARLTFEGQRYKTSFAEPMVRDAVHEAIAHDHNMRAAAMHVVADAAVSVLVIVGLLLARAFGWMWMDPLAGIIGACVIASWAMSLIRDTGAILLDRNPDPDLTQRMRQAIEAEGDQLADLHLWRLGPGHLGAIVSVVTRQARDVAFYRARLARFPSLSHLTIEILQEG